MKLYEFQAKKIFKLHKIPVPDGIVVSADSEIFWDKFPCILKIQILAGGRGKAGGILKINNLNELKTSASKLFSKPFKTYQTNLQLIPKFLLIEELVDIDKEFYAAITINRSIAKPVLIGSIEGGMDIEEVSKTSPEKIFQEIINPSIGVMPFQARKIAYKLNLQNTSDAANIFINMSEIFLKYDCTVVEINPLVKTKKNSLVAVDAKIVIDDNALFRHKELVELYDYSDSTQTERYAKEAGISFIPLDGNIGCLVNGAGLAMATMDLIKYHGGNPANFLDVGGGANLNQVTEAFKILLTQKNIDVIFVNIFGGIMRCDIIANAMVKALKETNKIIPPIVVRFEGTNWELGKEILDNSNLSIKFFHNLDQAAKTAVELSKM